MSFSASGFGMGPGTIGTLGFMSNYAKNSPEFRQLQGVQRTLQFANPRNQNTIDLMAYNSILSNMKPGEKGYSNLMAQRNSVFQRMQSPAMQNLEHIKNPKLRFAVGILSIVQQFLGIRY